MREALVDLSDRDLGEAELGKRTKFEIGVRRCERDLERSRRQARRLLAIARALRAREVEPSLLGAGRHVPKQPLCPRKPAARCRVVPESECVLPREPERNSRGPRRLAVSTEPCIRSFAIDHGIALFTEPPESSSEPVERLRGFDCG